ncbi:MAG: response regulator [Alphaproteobacteria bacterium]
MTADNDEIPIDVQQAAADAEDAEWELGNELLLLAQGAADPVTVLVVDDEPEIVEEIVEDLELDGTPTRQATRAMEALEIMAEDESIRIVVSDIRMPHMDGLQFLEEIQRRWPDRLIQVIILTGHAGYDEAVHALRLGAFEFLAKPISLGHLAHVIGRAQEVLRLKEHERNLKEFLVREIARLNHQIDRLHQENDALRHAATPESGT